MASFPVQCDFSKNSSLTIVHPLDWPEDGIAFPPDESARCLEPNCFSQTVTYQPNKLQLQVMCFIKSQLY